MRRAQYTTTQSANAAKSQGVFFAPQRRAINLVQLQRTETPPLCPQVPLGIFLLHGVSNTVAADVQRATHVFSPTNLDFPYTMIQVNEQETRQILGNDGVLEKSRDGATSYTREEVELIIPRFQRGVLNVFYVPGLSNQITAGYTIEIAGERVIIINQANNLILTHKPLEHEIGHALGLGHIPTDTQDPEASRQLMWPGVRVGDRLSAAEITGVLRSRYVRWP